MNLQDFFRNVEAPRSMFEKAGTFFRNSLRHFRSVDYKGIQERIHWYQSEAVLTTAGVLGADESEELRDGGHNHRNMPVVIQAPTGSGKSGMIVLLPYVLQSKKVLVLTPSKVISDQLAIAFGINRKYPAFLETSRICKSADEFEKIREPVRNITNPQEIVRGDRLENLVIVNAQKFGGRAGSSLVHRKEEIVKNVKEFFSKFDTLIVDEAHHYPAKTWAKIVDAFNENKVEGLNKKIVFLTATPYRIGKKGKEEFILGPEKEKLARIAFTVTPENVTGKTTRPCSFTEHLHDASAANIAKDIQDVFDKHNEEMSPRFKPQAMILVTRRAEAEDLVAELNTITENDNFAIAILGGDKNEKKQGEETALDLFSRGEYSVGVTCGVALEGYDNADVMLCVIKRKIAKSQILFNQFIGRCLRMHRANTESGLDETKAIVMSYKEFKQRRLWDTFESQDSLPKDDPVDPEDDEEEQKPKGRKGAGNNRKRKNEEDAQPPKPKKNPGGNRRKKVDEDVQQPKPEKGAGRNRKKKNDEEAQEPKPKRSYNRKKKNDEEAQEPKPKRSYNRKMKNGEEAQPKPKKSAGDNRKKKNVKEMQPKYSGPALYTPYSF